MYKPTVIIQKITDELNINPFELVFYAAEAARHMETDPLRMDTDNLAVKSIRSLYERKITLEQVKGFAAKRYKTNMGLSNPAEETSLHMTDAAKIFWDCLNDDSTPQASLWETTQVSSHLWDQASEEDRDTTGSDSED